MYTILLLTMAGLTPDPMPTEAECDTTPSCEVWEDTSLVVFADYIVTQPYALQRVIGSKLGINPMSSEGEGQY